MKFRQSRRDIRESKRNLKESFMDEYVPAIANDNALSIKEYLGTLMQSVVETWGLHLNTNKYSEHIALNEFYDEMLDLVDTLIENYKGIYGNIPAKAEVFKPEATNASEYLRELREFVEKGRSLFTDSEILSDIDSILSAIDECLYKVENLTENRKRNRRITKEVKDFNDKNKRKYQKLRDEVVSAFWEAFECFENDWCEPSEFVDRYLDAINEKSVIEKLPKLSDLYEIFWKNSVEESFFVDVYDEVKNDIDENEAERRIKSYLDNEVLNGFAKKDGNNYHYVGFFKNESNKRSKNNVKESLDIDKEQTIEITDEMKEKYPSLKNYDKIIISGKKMNFDEAEEYAKENNAILPNIEEGNDIVKFVVDGRKHISFKAWTREEADNAENAVYTVSTNGLAYTADNNKGAPLAKWRVFCLRSNKMNESNKRSRRIVK